MTRLDHISLAARDPMRLATFYCDLLGMRVLWQLPENAGAFLASAGRQNGFDFSFFRAPATPPQQDQSVSAGERTISSPHIALVVASLADLRACHQEVARLGGSYLFGVNHGVALSCHMLDPEGNQIEVAWPTGRHLGQRPVTAPIDLLLSEEDLLRIVNASLG
jgi:catechol 2,3-dioxygenase-like lactoylglutathione lyase family enzyme